MVRWSPPVAGIALILPGPCCDMFPVWASTCVKDIEMLWHGTRLRIAAPEAIHDVDTFRIEPVVKFIDGGTRSILSQFRLSLACGHVDQVEALAKSYEIKHHRVLVRRPLGSAFVFAEGHECLQVETIHADDVEIKAT